MVTIDLDPRLTFDTFVIGPANRLASAAARRAAGSPGTSYNPLFIYAGSGLGKSHLLTSIAHHLLRHDSGQQVVYKTIEDYLDELTQALESGEREALRERYRELDVLLVDDVQFLAGQPEAQEMLLRTLDALGDSGSQIVLASDRPPAEIDGLDERLLSRFSGGLIVDISAPEYETRVAIIRKKLDMRGAELAPGVAEAIARLPVGNVRELGGALNRIMAVQELEDRTVAPDEVPALLGMEEAATEGEGDALEEAAGEPGEEWQTLFRMAAEEAEAEGLLASRLRRVLQSGSAPDDPGAVVEEFRTGVERLREIRAEIARVGNPWPQTAEQVLRNPERLEEAEAFLTSVRERLRPFPALPPGPSLDELEGRLSPLGVKAARHLVREARSEYNPLYLWSAGRPAARELAGAAARTFVEENPGGVVALTSLEAFAEEFIDALGRGVAGAWRERWWAVDLLVVHDIERLTATERAQDEFFHLFEALKRRESLCLFAADRPPTGIEGIDERLRSRFEGGLVVEVEGDRMDPDAAERVPDPSAGLEGRTGRGWRPSPEKVVWEWPYVEERLVEELE